MKKFNTKLVSTFASYTVNSFDTSCNNPIPCNYDYYSSSVFVDNNTLISYLQKTITFKNELIVDNLINNKELLNCLTETLKLIADNGLYFHADLDIITDDISEAPQLLLVYYPINISNNTNISIQKSFSDRPYSLSHLLFYSFQPASLLPGLPLNCKCYRV